MVRAKGYEVSKHLRVRQGGGVKRFHTWTTIGEQTVAAHTWGVLAIILAIEPDASGALLRRAVYHDLAEYDTGDVPSTAKWASPNLKKMMDLVETHFNSLHNFPGDDTLTEYERDVLKMADLIEMLWYTYEQYMVGNRAIKVVCARVQTVIAQRKWTPGAYLERTDAMLAEIEQLFLDTNESEPS